MDIEQRNALEGKIIEMLKTIYDPEIPVDIYELGLIYKRRHPWHPLHVRFPRS